MAEYLIQDTTLSAIAEAIRNKTGKADNITPEQMPTEIMGITTGGGEGEKPFDCHSVTFMYGDTVLWVRSVADGDTCADPVVRGLIPTPTKESTAQYNYTFYGWGASDGGAADANILKNITEDKTVYAIFTATVRTYTITFYDDDGTTVLKTAKVAYGTVPSYTPVKTDHKFLGWTPEAEAVIGDASYVANWEVLDEIASGTFASGATWKLKTDGCMELSGNGAMDNYSGNPAQPWAEHRSKITKLVVGNGITSIGDYAFAFCSNLTVPSGYWLLDTDTKVSRIGNYAFQSCTALNKFVVRSTVKRIGQYAFSGCSGLTTLSFQKVDKWWYSTSSTATSGTGYYVGDNTVTMFTNTFAKYYWGYG